MNCRFSIRRIGQVLGVIGWLIFMTNAQSNKKFLIPPGSVPFYTCMHVSPVTGLTAIPCQSVVESTATSNKCVVLCDTVLERSWSTRFYPGDCKLLNWWLRFLTLYFYSPIIISSYSVPRARSWIYKALTAPQPVCSSTRKLIVLIHVLNPKCVQISKARSNSTTPPGEEISALAWLSGRCLDMVLCVLIGLLFKRYEI